MGMGLDTSQLADFHIREVACHIGQEVVSRVTNLIDKLDVQEKIERLIPKYLPSLFSSL